MKKQKIYNSFRGYTQQNSATDFQRAARRVSDTSSRLSFALATSFVELARDQYPL